VYEATVLNLVKRISSVICSELEIHKTIDEFQKLEGFPGVLGAIDRFHTHIRTPTEHHENYKN
jgi:hypothetical protein